MLMNHPTTSHKARTIKTLMKREQLVCDMLGSLCDGNRYLECVFYKNNYHFITQNTYEPTETDVMNRNPTPVTTVTITHIRALLRPSQRSYSPTTYPCSPQTITVMLHLITDQG